MGYIFKEENFYRQNNEKFYSLFSPYTNSALYMKSISNNLNNESNYYQKNNPYLLKYRTKKN